MPVAPSPAEIDGQHPWQPFDTSGIAFDFTKLDTMPRTLYETEGYREQLGEHGWETIRIWRCNWSDVADAMQWFYGYCYVNTQQSQNRLAPAPDGNLPGGAPFNAAAANTPTPGPKYLTRVIPAQDPYRPYLYADHVELVECLGVPLQDPGLFLTDITGANLDATGKIVEGQVLNDFTGPEMGVGGPPLGNNNDLPFQFELMLPGLMIPGLVYAEYKGPGKLVPGRTAGNFADGVATLRVTYRQRPYAVRNDVQNQAWGQGEIGRYVERQPHYAIQGLPLYNLATSTTAGQQLKFTEGFPGKVVPEAGLMLVPTGAWQYIWHDVPFYPAAAIENCMGRVNVAAFDGVAGFPSFPAESLLCQAPEITWRRNACGQISFRVVWNLDYRPAGGKGWNGFPAGDGNFWRAGWGGDPNKPVFQAADFSQLFAVGNTYTFN